MAHVKEGISPRLKNNEWFNQNIRAKAAKAFYIEANDNFHHQVVVTVDPDTGAKKMLLLKVTHTGYIKSTYNMTPGVAKELVKILDEMTK